MTHRFTDRDGVEWRVSWGSGGQAMAVPLGLDVSKIPAPPGGLHFVSEGFSFFVEMSQVEPAELTDEELQAMVDGNQEGE